MYLVLPNEEVGLASLLRTLTGQEFIGTARFAARTRPEKTMILGLPRLDLAWNSDDLAAALSAMGMPTAFDSSKADFGGIARRRPLFISRFVHKTRIKVGELGTEAAVASYMDIFLGFPPRVVFDRPYLFGIVDEQSGAVLFLGVVNDPRSK
jgi:serpin B